MNLNEKQIALLDGLYRNPSLGLLNAPALNSYLKQQGEKDLLSRISKNI